MSSELRRANATRSTGPVPPAGKAHPSRNDVELGMTALHNVLLLRQAGISNEANNSFASNKKIEINSFKVDVFAPKPAVSALKTAVFTPKKPPKTTNPAGRGQY